MARTLTAPPTSRWGVLGSPPVPREHGAWVMLLVPLATGLFVASPVEPVAAIALLIAAIAAFLAQNAAVLALRPRAAQRVGAWLGIYGAVLAAAGSVLMLGPGRWALLMLAVPGAALFALHCRLTRGPAGARLDRTGWGQALTAAVLASSGPAAWAAARGTLGWEAAVLWLAFFVAFISGILHVNMRLDAVKVRGAFDGATRWRLGRWHTVYHVALAMAALGAAGSLPSGWLIGVGLLPYVVRGFISVAQLGPGVPSFKRIGLTETAFAVWLAAWIVAALAAQGS